MDFHKLIEKIGVADLQYLKETILNDITLDYDDDDSEDLWVFARKYGVMMAFDRVTNKLRFIEAKNIDSKYCCLPLPLNRKMTHSDVRNELGDPIKSRPPVQIANFKTGGLDQFFWNEDKSLSILVYYKPETLLINGIKIVKTKDIDFK